MSGRFVSGIVALSLVLVGCGGTKVTRVNYDVGGNPRDYLVYLASRGPDVRTVVLAPAGADVEVLGRVVTDRMNADWNGPSVNFTTTPATEANTGYRMVMAVGAIPTLGQRLCRAVEDGVDPVGARVAPGIQAAFCYRERSLSEAYVEVASLSGPGDPNLGAAVSAVMLRVFPQQIPPDNGGECPLGALC